MSPAQFRARSDPVPGRPGVQARLPEAVARLAGAVLVRAGAAAVRRVAEFVVLAMFVFVAARGRRLQKAAR